MSDLSKAIDMLRPHVMGRDGYPMYAKEISMVRDAARRWDVLTSPETITGNDAVLDWIELWLGNHPWETAIEIVASLLRAVVDAALPGGNE